MSHVWITGFENGTTEHFYQSSGAFSIQTSNVKTGTYSLKINPTATVTPAYFGFFALTSAGVMPNTGPSTAYMKFDFMVTAYPTANDELIASIIDFSTGNPKVEIRINSSGNLLIYDTTPTLQGTGATVLSLNTYYRIELRGGTGTAAYELRINGSTELSGTCNQLAGAACSGFYLGKYRNRNTQSYTAYFDDLVVRDDTWPGATQVLNAIPIANGGVANWNLGTGATDYTQVREVPIDNDTTYIKCSTGGSQEHRVTVQSMSTLGISGSTIKAVQVNASTRCEAGTSSSFIRLRSSATNADSGGNAAPAAFSNSSAGSWKHWIRDTDPATSAAWLESAFNAIEIGIFETNAVADRCTHLSATVAYAVAATGTIAATLGKATLSASGAEEFTGTASATCGNATSAASGAETITGTIAITGGNATIAASGLEALSGTLAATTGNVTSADSGTEMISGSIAAALGAVICAMSGTGGSASTPFEPWGEYLYWMWSKKRKASPAPHEDVEKVEELIEEIAGGSEPTEEPITKKADELDRVRLLEFMQISTELGKAQAALDLALAKAQLSALQAAEAERIRQRELELQQIRLEIARRILMEREEEELVIMLLMH